MRLHDDEYWTFDIAPEEKAPISYINAVRSCQETDPDSSQIGC